MKIENIKYSSFFDFFEDILPTGKLSDKLNGFVFRGEPTNKYKLLPSALRLENKDRLWRGNKPIDDQSEWESWQIHAEYILLRDFYKIANNNGLKVPYIESIRDNFVDCFPTEKLMQMSNYKWISKEIEELAALAQHYGILTRLLDWTWDINIAFYFAAIGAIKQCVKNEFINNDTIVIWALNAQHIQFLQPTVDMIPLKFVVPSYYSNPNLNAQKGVLSYWEIEMNSNIEEIRGMYSGKGPKLVDRTPLDEVLAKYCSDNKDDNITLLYKFEFPKSDCIKVFESISKFGYEASRIFPGYSGVTRQIEEQVLLNELQKSRKIV
ncbi:FRG domain-containing protein [Oceanirhabdus sp. W0125-5]|uniref:FRG domain-containing protein n=1 Tax=Oceanirhabdus sp. W0125-5 TaxID=2999116 RepID=UPI0022F316BB|nr:FRG domain-containing protein [Oceanirhabdus sp. W0125-5]WBW98835.1 FRG domain-containing protein [Oceanirhabdus sp. W0125-5]